MNMDELLILVADVLSKMGGLLEHVSSHPIESPCAL